MDKFICWLSRCVALSFRLYPRSYRKDFGEEMHSVYTQAALDAKQSGFLVWLFFLTHEIRGVIPAVIREYGLVFLRGGKQMLMLDEVEKNVPGEHSLQPVDPHPWASLLAGSAIFVIWGLAAIVSEIAFSSNEPWFSILITVSDLLSWIIFLLPPLVVVYAWRQNFPRWTYPYVGIAILSAILMDGIPLPKFPFSGGSYTPWGWRAWIPLILAIGLGLLSTRSLRPLRCFFSNAWEDWTLLSYAMFGWAPIFILAGFDEIASGYTLIFMPLVVSLMVATSLLYMAQPSVHQRGLVLFGGASLSLAIMMVATEIYWSGVGGFNTSRIVLVLTVFLGVMFMPALVGLFRYFYQRGTPHPA